VNRRNGFLLAGLVVALLLAGLVSGVASSDPDGLERVAEDTGFAEAAEDHHLAGSPLAEYGFSPVENERLGTGLAGVIGVGLTFALGLGLFALVRRRGGETARPGDTSVPAP
jgi:hypothetical protein